MITKLNLRVLAVIMAIAIVGLGSTRAAAEEKPAYVKAPLKLNTALVVPDSKMVGRGYKIDPEAVNDGFSNTYTLKTEVGDVQAVSDYQLARQIQEINALIILDEMSKAGVFGDAMKEGLVAPIRGGKALVTAPVETTKGAVKGVGRWVGNIGRSIGSDDPYQEGGVSAATGWANTKRAFALELGVDPYTDWEPLQQALTAVARAAFAGGITVGVAMGAVTEGTTVGTVITVLSLTDEMNAILLDNPPEGLTKINREKLEKMGISKKTIDPFLKNYNYTPMEKTMLVEALNQMKDTKGRDLFISQATAAPDKIIARYYHQMSEMMLNYQKKHGAADIVQVQGEVWLLTRKGVLVGAFPIDYLAWTAETAKIAGEIEQNPQAQNRELWLEGSASPECNKALTARGWKIKERVALLTGKPLQDVTAAGAGLGATATTIQVIAK
ncbi:MAG: hypothetical protein R3274_00635 [Desulfobacterales bacterium]|nr:hypothetical protein [Desulfobacterales bacterium]